MNEDLFYKCSEINDYLIDGDEPKARDLLIRKHSANPVL